ncbi:MAG TPA: response regulator [Nitrososphaeraceae archaeon]
MKVVSEYDMRDLVRVPDPSKVMIIEDDLDLLILYKDYLMKSGCIVIATSSTAEEILVDYKSYRPDFVILDYNLPGTMNGLRAAGEILNIDPNAKIIILTAFSDVKQELERSSHFRGKNIKVILKPIQISYLKSLVFD